MIVEFVILFLLTFPNVGSNFGPHPTQIDFVEPVKQVITYPPAGVENRLSGLQLPDGTLTAYETDFLTEHVFLGRSRSPKTSAMAMSPARILLRPHAKLPLKNA